MEGWQGTWGEDAEVSVMHARLRQWKSTATVVMKKVGREHGVKEEKKGV